MYSCYLTIFLCFVKIEAVVRRILWATLNDQDAKILVFSSWNDVLDVLGHALAANNITFVRMKGGRYCRLFIIGIILELFLLKNSLFLYVLISWYCINLKNSFVT